MRRKTKLTAAVDLCGHVSRSPNITWVCVRPVHIAQPNQHHVMPEYELTDLERTMTGYAES